MLRQPGQVRPRHPSVHGDADHPPERQALEAGNLAYWTAIIDGSGNLAYRLALNTLVAGFAAVCAVPSGADIIAALHEEYRRADAMRELADAISAQDATAAQRIAADLLGSVAV